MTNVREQMESIRKAAGEEVEARTRDLDELRLRVTHAKRNLGLALRDGVDVGLSMDELAGLSGLSSSTVRKYVDVMVADTGTSSPVATSDEDVPDA